MWFQSTNRSVNKVKVKIKELFQEINSEYLDEVLQNYNFQRNSAVEITARISEKLIEMDGGYPKISSLDTLRDVDLLNNQLVLLLDMFPDVASAVIRDYSRMFTNCISFIVEKVIRLKGVYEKRVIGAMVQERDLFRSMAYRKQVKTSLLNEFPFHWESTITAIMAESNNYYPDCYAKLKEIKPSNLWTAILPFSKRSWIEFPMDDDSLIREMEEMKREALLSETEKDQDLARGVNEQEYEHSRQFITCQCCFGDTVFEELGQCKEGHLFCYDCMCRSLKIGLFDTGTIRGKALKCMSSEIECSSDFSIDEIKRVCLASNNKNLFIQYQGTLWEAMLKSIDGADFATCPFCKYAEEKPREFLFSKYVPEFVDFIVKYAPTASRLMGMILIFYITLYSPLTATILILIKNHISLQRDALFMYLQNRFTIPTWAKRQSPLVLNCKNTDCLKASCTKCGDLWLAPHICFEKQIDSLRLYVENAKSNALIRVCPSCSIRFSKLDGCNKMTCPNCKYEMCYICRRDIGSQKYDHFCQHFRLIPGSDCKECKKCELFQKERDEISVAKAAKKAEIEWKRMNPNDADKVL